VKRIVILSLGVALLLLACTAITIAVPGLAKTATPSRSTPSRRPTVPATLTITATFTVTPTSTPSPIPTATWVHQGPDAIIVPILLYHHIAASSHNSRYYVSPEKFDAELKLLHDWEYTTITTEMLVNAVMEGADLPPRPLLITFDDGNLDNYFNAFPIMQKYGFTGVVYIIGNYMGTPGYMNADQIKVMAAAGWEVGSHSMNHLDLSELDPQRQRYEIVESREKLESELGFHVMTFAYPFGITSTEIIDYTEFAGYIAGMGLGSSADQFRSNLYYLQRSDVKGTFDFKQFISLLPWRGDPIYLPTNTPTPTP